MGGYDAANERMANVSRFMQTVDSSAFNMANWFAGQAVDCRQLTFGTGQSQLTFGDLQPGKDRSGVPNVTSALGIPRSPIWTMTTVRVLSWEIKVGWQCETVGGESPWAS